MNTRTAQIIPEHGPSPLVDASERRVINQALNKALTRELPPFPDLTLRRLDTLSAPESTYLIQDTDRTLTLVGSLSAAKVQFPPARLNSGRQLHFIFRNTPDAPSLTAAPTGGTIPAGVFYAVLTFLPTGGGETLASLPRSFRRLRRLLRSRCAPQVVRRSAV